MADRTHEETRAERSLKGALSRFRSAGREDGTGPVLERAATAASAPRRRDEAIEHARAQGLDGNLAGLVYDTAREEGLEPAFAFELVRSGIGVCEIRREPLDESTIEGPPEWIDPAPPVAPERERRMRASFRRLRGCLERCTTPEQALAAFAGDPDVGECRY